jgi:hypothetical protein
MNSTISTPFLSQKTAVITFLAGRQHLFKFFGLFGECVCIHCFDCTWVSTFTNKTQFPAPVTLKIRLRISSRAVEGDEKGIGCLAK